MKLGDVYLELMDPDPPEDLERQHWQLVIEVEGEDFDAFGIGVWG